MDETVIIMVAILYIVALYNLKNVRSAHTS